MAKFKFEVVGTYSDVIEIEADNAERAYDLAIDSAPNWIDIGDKMAYPESVDAYPIGNNEEENK